MKNLFGFLFVVLLITSCGKEAMQDVEIKEEGVQTELAVDAKYYHVRNADGSVAKFVDPQFREPIYEHMKDIGMDKEAELFLATYTERGKMIPAMEELNMEGRSTEGVMTSMDKEAANWGGHLQNIGWTYGNDIEVTSGEIFQFGTTGQSRRLEAYFFIFYNYALSYESELQGIGWQGTKTSGQVTGTTGQSREMYATRMFLTGGPTAGFVSYQPHIENIGWAQWRNNGQIAGTPQSGLRIEALRVRFFLF